jgi:hypothetical protein
LVQAEGNGDDVYGMLTTLRFVLTLCLILPLAAAPLHASPSPGTSAAADYLSPYWGGAITQWTRLILYWAEARELDPDLVAAVIRKESIGRANAEGAYGGVGLMMVLPAEDSGLPWRPSTEELKQPNVNLRWGTGMLAQIIRDSGGNVLRALAAYNGGWEQVHLEVTQDYAYSVLTHYAYAIAGRHGYSYDQSKVWTMVLVTRAGGRINRIQTLSSGHFLGPCFEGAVEFRELFPEMTAAPRTRVARFVDAKGNDVLIDAWLYVGQDNVPVVETLVESTTFAASCVGK